MKQTNYALTAVAAVALLFFACQKDGQPATVDSAAPKIVSLTIKNLVPASATRVAASGFSTEGIKVADAGELWVLFAGATGILERFDLGDLPENVDVNGATYTFHELPAAVDRVAVTNAANAATAASFAALTDALDALALSGLQVVDLAAPKADDPATEGENEAEFIPVYGEDLSLETTGIDTHDDGTSYVYKAGTVTVVPRLARIEIGGIGCTDLDFYESTVDESTGETSVTYSPYSALTLARIGVDKTSLTTIDGEAYTYPAEGEGATEFRTATGWNVDDFENVTIEDDDVLEGVFAYNVAPSAVPRVILEVSGGAKNTDPALSDLNPAFGWSRFVKTKALYETVTPEQGAAYTSEITSFEPGHVYQVNFAFASKDVKPWYEDPTLICVDVAVTIPDWVIHAPTTPTFE